MAPMRRVALFSMPLAAALTACAAPPLAPPDTPVPPGEPRAEVRLVIDLERASDCEETFDLAVYRDRRIDLVTWDASPGRCDGRVVVVRYLAGRVSRDEVVHIAERAARKVTPIADGAKP
jgi:hypothetical protein